MALTVSGNLFQPALPGFTGTMIWIALPAFGPVVAGMTWTALCTTRSRFFAGGSCFMTAAAVLGLRLVGVGQAGRPGEQQDRRIPVRVEVTLDLQFLRGFGALGQPRRGVVLLRVVQLRREAAQAEDHQQPDGEHHPFGLAPGDDPGEGARFRIRVGQRVTTHERAPSGYRDRRPLTVPTPCVRVRCADSYPPIVTRDTTRFCNGGRTLCLPGANRPCPAAAVRRSSSVAVDRRACPIRCS